MMENSNEAEILNAKLKIERDERLKKISIIVPAFAGIFIITYTYIFQTEKFSLINDFLNLFGPLLLLMALFFALIHYLQTGFKKQTVEDVLYKNNNKTVSTSISIGPTPTNITQEEISKINGYIALLEERVNTLESFNNALSSNQKEEYVNIIKSKIIEESINEASTDILKNLDENIKKSLNISQVEIVLTRTIERLREEIDSLTRRGNINLILGGMTTIVGLIILAYFVYEIGTPSLLDKVSYIANFIPRLSVVILIEVFAFFFLKLYKSTLSEMKYFQNEMTNTEAKLAAIKCSIITSDKDGISTVIRELITTERNAIIEKGQTTVEIEKNRLEQQNTTVILDKLSKILAVNKKP
ncbi:TPA: hypothetical protein RST38_005024 [Klebsiella pneumoniae]|uniref:hypothetical protein n=1 Tax=Klebsiella pneumoniae TaxID=573 RepID=UPI0020CD5A38|nr:hypothetical protein [Klebsiella pneumoniae]MCQ0552432.1 hypothetical protein [Klebsiella pneumoniae]HBR1064635.1 hypothetical protein [Klebsiella pneumoniae]HDZ2962509.1 hypothetical protein [Klebsiella pneumoniae]